MKYPPLRVRKKPSASKPWRVLNADTGGMVAAFYCHKDALGYALNLIEKFQR